MFGLVNVLGRHGVLTPEEEDFRRQANAWYDANYPNSTTDGSDAYARRQAVSWFKREAPRHLLEPLPRYLAILDAHSVEWEKVESDDPGEVLYEDDVQVIAAPHSATS